MEDLSNYEAAVELLQQLGLKEYESKTFVTLSGLPRGTAKDVSDRSEVPRTRVYDAIRVLETKGLVEIQHSSPQEFRTVPIDEAVAVLREEYEDRTDSLREALEGIEATPATNDTEAVHEVWTLAGESSIKKRTLKLLDDVEEELVFIIGSEAVLTESLLRRLQRLQEYQVTILIGTTSESLQSTIVEKLPDVKVFVSGLEWLHSDGSTEDQTEITRIILVDRSTILVSTSSVSLDTDAVKERAVFGRGFDNGLVAITRRLMATGLAPSADPTIED